MDKTSRVLAGGLPEDMPSNSPTAHGDVSPATLHHRTCRQRSIESKAQDPRYLAVKPPPYAYLLHIVLLRLAMMRHRRGTPSRHGSTHNHSMLAMRGPVLKAARHVWSHDLLSLRVLAHMHLVD
jgi:hypothetical protein